MGKWRGLQHQRAEGEEGSGDTFDYNYVGYDTYYDDNGISSANFESKSKFDLESEEYHCLDMAMVGSELAGITVLKCNSGHLTKCCPRLVN